jgi:hypothetical protein
MTNLYVSPYKGVNHSALFMNYLIALKQKTINLILQYLSNTNNNAFRNCNKKKHFQHETH